MHCMHCIAVDYFGAFSSHDVQTWHVHIIDMAFSIRLFSLQFLDQTPFPPTFDILGARHVEFESYRCMDATSNQTLPD